MGNKSKRNGVPQPITRRQQIAALRQMKADEVAANLAENIRGAVKQEVERQLKSVMDTVMSCIDRVMDIEQIIQDWTADEDTGDDRQERAEATEVPEDDAVVPEPGGEGQAVDCPDPTEGAASG